VNSPSFEDVPPRRRRWLIAMGLFRASATTAVLVALYFLLPMNGHLEGSTLVFLLAGLAVLVGVTAWQVLAIIRSRYPAVQAVQALAVSISLLLLTFASTYYLLGQADHANFTQGLTRVDALYFTVTTFATVGFGDITAATQTARIVVIVQIVFDLVALGAGLRILLGAVRMGRERHTGSSDERTPPSP
jgi:hypothetical protein